MTDSKPKILVVDDEKHIRMLYQMELESEGYVVATADGEEPIENVLARENPAVVILDIRLGPYYVVKSVDLSELKDKVRQALARSLAGRR